MDDSWATPILTRYGIQELSKLSNFRVVRKMIIALNTLAANDLGAATNLLLAQPDVARFIKENKPESASSLSSATVADHHLGKTETLSSLTKKNNNIISSEDKSQNIIKKESMPYQKKIKQEPSKTAPTSINPIKLEEPIDIIEIDSDEDADIRIKLDQSEIVCFGVISTSFSSVQQSILHTCLGQLTTLDICIMAEPTGNPSIYALRVDTLDGHKIGYVERKMCITMSPLLRNLRIEGTIPRPITVTSQPILYLTLFGSRSIVHHLGTYLTKQQIILGPVMRPVAFPCQNPHAHLANQRQELMQIGQTTKTVDEVKSHIDTLYNTLVSAEDLPEMEPDPRLITNLYPHQKQALHFLYNCENPQENNGGGLWKKHLNGSYENLITGDMSVGTPKFHKGGILADDMGLGKTIEVISLILKTTSQSAEFTSNFKNQLNNSDVEILEHDPSLVPTKGTLIICPLSTVSNWEDQIQSHVRRGALSVYVYHGASRCQDPRILSKFNVVLTTYNILSIEYGKDLKNLKRTQTDATRPNTKLPVFQMNSILHKMLWFRIVLDEAHLIKDTNTGQAKAACALSADRKWSLTGTPIQNKLEDLYSLINFINVEPFSSKNAWTNYITKALKLRAPSGGSIGVSRLQTLMKSITLRRTKMSKIRGKPILSLPPRIDRVEKLTLDITEQTLYDRASAQAKKVFENFEKEGTVLRHYVHLLELILKLRQICTHPLLCKNYEELMSQTDDSGIKWDQERAVHLLGLLKDTGDDNCCSCGSYVDEIETMPYVTKCGHLLCETCHKKLISETSIQCPMCQSSLFKSDILSVSSEEDENAIVTPVISNKLKLKGGLNPNSISSTKLNSLLEDLKQVKADNDRSNEAPVKSVIFSQWTSMLDLIERPLLKEGHRFVRLDGRMSRAERTLSLDKFKKDNMVTIMLISLKAGGVGLNLTSASRVYMFEPYWNPAVEQQAVDRVHRLGQTRPVHTIRYIVSGTIEDSIIEMQKRKIELTNITFKEGIGGGDLSALDHKKRKRVDAQKDKEKLQQQKMQDLRMMFNLDQKRGENAHEASNSSSLVEI